MPTLLPTRAPTAEPTFNLAPLLTNLNLPEETLVEETYYQTNVTLRINATFNATVHTPERFRTLIAMVRGVDEAMIEVLSVRSGSIIVVYVFVEPPTTGPSLPPSNRPPVGAPTSKHSDDEDRKRTLLIVMGVSTSVLVFAAIGLWIAYTDWFIQNHELLNVLGQNNKKNTNKARILGLQRPTSLRKRHMV